MNTMNTSVTLTHSVLAVRQVRWYDDPPLLSDAQPLQRFVYPLDHVSHAHVGVVSAVPPVAEDRSVEPQ